MAKFVIFPDNTAEENGIRVTPDWKFLESLEIKRNRPSTFGGTIETKIIKGVVYIIYPTPIKYNLKNQCNGTISNPYKQRRNK